MVLPAERPDGLVSEYEADTMLIAPLGAVMILPIRSAGDVIGTLSLASVKKSRRRNFSREERQFAHLIALLTSSMIVKDRRIQASANWSIVNSTDRQIRSRLKSSLSGILGSLELIRTSEYGHQDLGHYLQIIDKSAQRINDYLMTGTTASPEMNEGGEDDV
jgi:transcriptional regulator with GAF, ATPase, and Fis domain